MWRGARTAWIAHHRRELRERAKERCEGILKTHETSPPLEPEVEKKMAQFLKDLHRRTS